MAALTPMLNAPSSSALQRKLNHVAAPLLLSAPCRIPQPWHLPKPCIHSVRPVWCKSSQGSGRQPEDGKTQPASSSAPEQDNNLLYNLGMGALWLGFVGYAFFLSPDQTPYRDQIFIRLLVGLREPDETFVVNQVYTALFNVMGVLPLIYAALLVPAGRSANKVPAWPFVTVSFGLGALALLPYFALWKPAKGQQLPPPKEELEGWNRVFMKGAETPVLPLLLLAAGAYQIFLAATAGDAAWVDYFKLVEESRLVHVTTLDFLTLTALAPFWMYNDAEGRKWEQRDTLLPVLSVLPVVGPAIYLLLRPKTKTA